MEDSGIDKAVLHYPTSDAHIKLNDEEKVCKVYNDGLSKIVRKYPHKFIGLGIVPLQDKEKMLYEFKRCIKELGIRGISLASSYDGAYLDDKRFYPTDVAGVTLAAVKALNEKLEKQEEKIKSQATQIDELKSEINSLKAAQEKSK